MATYDSSAYETALAAYYENADYLAENSPVKAKAFITACTQLIGIVPSKSSHGGRDAEAAEFKPEVWAAEKRDAMTWLAQYNQAAAGSVRGFSLENFR